MFLKIVKSADKTDYLYVVESYRDAFGNIKHRYLFSLGRLQDFISSSTFKKLAHQSLQADKGISSGIDLSFLSEGEVMKYGHLVIKRLWDKYRLDDFFRLKSRRGFDISKAVFYMASKHILEPDSKLGMYESREKYINFSEMRLNHLYRALDDLADAKEEIEEYIFESNRTIFNMEIDVVFYDVTTIYFESNNEDILRKYGYSKDGKIKEAQIVLGLLIDREGRPIGYDIFSGNTFEGKTLEVFLLKLKERFLVQRVVIVADRGINSKINLMRLRELGYGYIVGCRFKGMREGIKEEIFKEDGYRVVETGDEEYRYKIIEYKNIVRDEAKREHILQENIVVSYSSKRARKDKQERERLIKKAMELIQTPSKIKAMSKRGGRKYLKGQTGDLMRWQIDRELIERDEAYDGYYAIQTSEKEMTAEEIIEAYHNLWKIEESFRLMKTTLEVRPVFHWTERRIRGHLVMCFISFLMLRGLEVLLKEEEEGGCSIAKIREALNSLTVTKIRVKEEAIYLKNKPEPLAMKIMRKLKISPPKKITSEKEFTL